MYPWISFASVLSAMVTPSVSFVVSPIRSRSLFEQLPKNHLSICDAGHSRTILLMKSEENEVEPVPLKNSQQAAIKLTEQTGPSSFRLVATLIAVGLAARGSSMTRGTLRPFLHLLSFSMVLGSNFYTSFVAGIIMFKNLPRQTFGKLQAKLLPAYFLLNCACTITTLVTMIGSTNGCIPLVSSVPLLVVLVCNLINLFIVEPKTTDVLFMRYDLENAGKSKSEEYSELAVTFGKLHGVSLLLNLGAFIGIAVYAWRLAQSVTL